MTLLLIGSCKSPYLHSLVTALEPHGFRVDLADPYTGRWKACGEEGMTSFWEGENSGDLSQFQRAMALRRFLKGRHYDICNVHYNSVFYGLVWKRIRGVAKRLVVSIWGADMESGWMIRRLQSCLLKAADLVTINNPDRANQVAELFGLSHAKVKVAFMPLETLSLIDEAFQQGINSGGAKQTFSWPADQPVVLCGTNAYMEQRHLEILESIEGAALDCPDVRRAKYVFPLTYEGTSEYIASIVERIEESTLDTVILREFLPIEDLVHLRIASDVLIQVQRKDMFSAAIQEALYVGCQVVGGTWLPYGFLKSEVSGLHCVDFVADVGGLVSSLLKNSEIRGGAISEIRKFGGIEESGKSWAGLFRELL